MTTLKETRLKVWAADLGGESTLPCLYDIKIPKDPVDIETDEGDGLWTNYDIVRTAFPYRAQECYSRELTVDGLDAVELENSHLKATFVPSLGGKLWSLYDKDAGRELLFANHVFRPAYLAIRNAWASGGVEWNCGAFTGHNPHTCAPLFTVKISARESGIGCPVLRMYTYERIRRVTYQMDFYLPEDAKVLHCRMRVVNDNFDRTDMYWWSNIAVPSNPKARNVVPADFAFTMDRGHVKKVAIPNRGDIDISYPTNNPIAIDYFYQCHEKQQPYTAHLDEKGYGLFQTSTERLKGRKLFVWGKGQGGAKWQEYLSGDDGHGKYSAGRYCEIQCGLAYSQYECPPMPPKTAWEWIEYYGPLQAEPAHVHGTWQEAQREVAARVKAIAPMEDIEEELVHTRPMATKPMGTMILQGLGWGALENERRKTLGMQPLCPHLDFGTCGEEQALWMTLLKTGSLREAKMPDDTAAPLSYQRTKEWMRLLKKAAQGPDAYYWLTHYMLGCAYLSECECEDAARELDISCRLHQNAWNTYALAELYRVRGEAQRAAVTMLAAARMAPGDNSLCKITARTVAGAGMWQELKTFIEGLDEVDRRMPRILLYRAMAAIHLGELELADEILSAEGGLEVPDIQEGEVSITKLWYDLKEKQALRDGVPFDKDALRPPKKFDFRMDVVD